VSKVISFRVPENLYEQFERRCKDEGTGMASRLKEFVKSQCYSAEKDTDEREPVKVIEVEREKLDVVKDTKKKLWLGLDFSPLFGEDR
jgi:hypothetical protein